MGFRLHRRASHSLGTFNGYPLSFSATYDHPEYLMQLYTIPPNALLHSSVDSVGRT